MADTGCVTKGDHKRDKRLSMRISSPLLARLQKRAKADRRSVADWTLLLIEAELDRLDKLDAKSR